MAKPNVLFVLGGPGSGKGTNCGLITENYEFVHLSAGDLLRAERNNPDSEQGQLISNYIKEGKIVPVDITVNLLLDAMKKSGSSNFLIDGFPRNEDNLSGWNRVAGDSANVLGCLYFDCPEKVMEQRLLKRGETSGRTDDNIESIRKRFHTYINETMPIINVYKQKNQCFTVVSDRPMDQVYADVEEVLNNKLGYKKRSAIAKKIQSIPKDKLLIGLAGAAVVLFIANRFLRTSTNKD